VPQDLKAIRRRIRSVQNTEKITAAMKAVAAAKLRRAQERAQAARPYADKMREVLVRVAANAGDSRHPLLALRPVRATCLVLITGDRGLAGPFNANLIRTAATYLADRPGPCLIAVGRTGRDYFHKRGYNLLAEFIGIGDDARLETARSVGAEIVGRYMAGECDEVHLVYARFVNAITSRPVVAPLLPLRREAAAQGHDGRTPYIFEPEAEDVLVHLLPHYVDTLVYRALLESKASEHGARMAAMDNASKNAGEVIERLTLLRNRVRQAAITREIAEIVGGANALQQT
jgi:F-type H+-transporting ATPase subunit gamma